MNYKILIDSAIINPFYMYYERGIYTIRYNLKVTHSMYTTKGFLDMYKNGSTNAGLVFNRHVNYYVL